MTPREKALNAVMANITYTTPAGNTNCRFCDNDMDHQGTHRDMHDKGCVAHQVTAAITALASQRSKP